MGFYSDVILPRLCDLAMRNKQLVPFRERVIGAAEGRVLEIGVGSGMNLPFYRQPVREIVALEPAPRLVTMARSASQGTSTPVSLSKLRLKPFRLTNIASIPSSRPGPCALSRRPPRLSQRCGACCGRTASSCSLSTASRQTRACVGGRTG